MADIASPPDAEAAVAAGADIVGTTLSGYTSGPAPETPDIDLVFACASLPSYKSHTAINLMPGTVIAVLVSAVPIPPDPISAICNWSFAEYFFG